MRLSLPMLLAADGDSDRLAEFANLIRGEVNMKHVELTTDVVAHGEFEIAINARAVGPRRGKDVRKMTRAVKPTCANAPNSDRHAVTAGSSVAHRAGTTRQPGP